MRFMVRRALVLCAMVAVCQRAVAEEANILADPSFEITKDRDQFGLVFAKWGGWKFEGDCDFRVGHVAHSGKTSCLLVGGAMPKIRIQQTVELEPGRYRITAWLRGLDITPGTYNALTEFMFDGKYIQLGKGGTFGWTPITYVADVAAKKQISLSFGLMGVGYFWIDDVTLTRVGNDIPVTDKPLLGDEEAPIALPGKLNDKALHCPECGYQNLPEWNHCYACGTSLLTTAARFAGPVVKPIEFLDRNPFEGTTITNCVPLEGKALRFDAPYAVDLRPQNWLGYDFLKIDFFSDSADPRPIGVEIQDQGTRDYWTRVNYTTIIPPGRSTLTIPVKQLYVGEKSRPGRMLDLAGIRKFVISQGENKTPLFMINLRLERDESPALARFDGLYAFDLGTNTSPVLEGFTQITPGTLYNPGRGYGLKNARIFRAFDALQPDPLYQDFICIESGGLAVDVPNGKYRVMVNMDSPSGFWGEYQVYSRRSILRKASRLLRRAWILPLSRRSIFVSGRWKIRLSTTHSTNTRSPIFRRRCLTSTWKTGSCRSIFRERILHAAFRQS